MLMTYEVKRIAAWLSHVNVTTQDCIVGLEFIFFKDRPIAIVTINGSTIECDIVGKPIV
jgi:hypothetical protein